MAIFVSGSHKNWIPLWSWCTRWNLIPLWPAAFLETSFKMWSFSIHNLHSNTKLSPCLFAVMKRLTFQRSWKLLKAIMMLRKQFLRWLMHIIHAKLFCNLATIPCFFSKTRLFSLFVFTLYLLVKDNRFLTSWTLWQITLRNDLIPAQVLLGVLEKIT